MLFPCRHSGLPVQDPPTHRPPTDSRLSHPPVTSLIPRIHPALAEIPWPSKQNPAHLSQVSPGVLFRVNTLYLDQALVGARVALSPLVSEDPAFCVETSLRVSAAPCLTPHPIYPLARRSLEGMLLTAAILTECLMDRVYAVAANSRSTGQQGPENPGNTLRRQQEGIVAVFLVFHS